MKLKCHFKAFRCLSLADSHQADIEGLHALNSALSNRYNPASPGFNNRPALSRIKSKHTG